MQATTTGTSVSYTLRKTCQIKQSRNCALEVAGRMRAESSAQCYRNMRTVPLPIAWQEVNPMEMLMLTLRWQNEEG